ncbi:MAG: hypothetical protein ACI8RZ_004233 [Myxococcota bacterium]|jgi:hypothetical protein
MPLWAYLEMNMWCGGEDATDAEAMTCIADEDESVLAVHIYNRLHRLL